MDIKKEIELILEKLKKAGKDRADIEKTLEYSENYIDQTLSRGGNKKVLAALKLYAQVVLQNTIPINGPLSMVNEDPVHYTTNYDRLLSQILSDRQTIIDQLEARRLQSEEMAKKMESHYEDAKVEKGKLLDIINSTLKEISGNLKDTALSLKSNHDFLLAIGRTVRSNDAEIMEALDHLEGNPVGTRQKRSHTVQKALREGVEVGAAGKKTGTGKTSKDVG